MNSAALNEARGSAWTKVHNVYLEYAVDLGLPGLLLFLLLFHACLAKARSTRRRAASVPSLRELCCLAEGVEISLLAFAVAAFFHPVAYHFYFYYPAGLAVAVGGVYRKLSPPEGNHP
jgi:O-antigen ligase